MLKTHSCGELRKENIGNRVTLAGWVDRRRDHGGLIFIDLRDMNGVIQVVFNPALGQDCHQIASEMRNEYVVRISGEVAPRPKGTENTKLPTGEVEVIAQSTTILNRSKTPPFYINEDSEIEESVRLKYRYLDLRRARMQRNMLLRHRVVRSIRQFLDAKGFIEVETPIMIKSTPEGARDYLVPSRLYPGKFYALPQSPQQMKQLLMVGGIEKYFQIARCFRDEDTRADRQPEFTQLDLEMSFVEQEDILSLVEPLLNSMVEAARPGTPLSKPFRRLRYADAMEHYGTDKPDLRFGLEIGDLSDIASRTDFSVFRSLIAEGGKVKGICAPGCASYTRTQLDELNKLGQSLGAKGLLTISLGSSPGSLDDLTTEMVKSVAAKYMTLDQVKEMAKRLGGNMGDLLLIVAGKPALVSTVLGELRQEMGRRLKLAEPDKLAFAFVLDFPLLERDEKAGRWTSVHHPFTAPRDEDILLLDSAPEKVRGKHYDVVCNGYEIGGGSLRIYQSEWQRKIFRLLGYPDAEIDGLFGHMLEAFEYGAPPHGGIALGIDRIAMLLAGESTIREMIAFPKNQSAADLTFNAPSTVTEEQLAELHIKLREEL
ncbi:MAG: aspartyl-tRNA synthetase [Dehalococcoidales bacterium]|nr:aspartyl-tRNA synthetase [Dehalococcoidales bacterium]